MKVTNVSARAYTVRGVVIAPGQSAEVPDEAKADLKGLEKDLKAGEAEAKKAAKEQGATGEVGGEMTSTEEANTPKITPHPGKKG